MAAAFVLGEAISLGITIYNGRNEYGSMGAVMAAIFGVIAACVLISIQFSQGFGYAVKMGVSRRNYLVGAFASAFALMVLTLAGTALLQGLDMLAVKIAMPQVYYEFSLLTALPWHVTLGAALGICVTAVALSAVVGALLLRFGKRFFVVLWVIWMGVCFLPRPVVHILSGRDQSGLLGAAIVKVFDLMAQVPGWGWLALGAAAVAGCYFAAVHILKKQPVTI